MVPIALVFVLSVALTFLCSAVPWLARSLPKWPLIIGLVVGVTLSLIDAVGALPFSPWTNLVVLVVAWNGGLLLGRSVEARFRPFLLLFLRIGGRACSTIRPPCASNWHSTRIQG